jgi:hypothetical protein
MTPKQLKALQQKWNKRLETEGLPDLEDSKGRLKSWHSWRFHHLYSPAEYEERIAYYSKCEEILHSYAFKDKRTKMVWYLHSQGYGFREISAILTKYGVKTSYSWAWSIVQRVKKDNQWMA